MTLELALPVGAASIALDVDRFDAIVASLGHEAGDEVLAALTQRLGAAIGPGQTLAHVGGHERYCPRTARCLAAATALREHGARITRAGLKATYTDYDSGWFGAAGGRPDVERRLDVLSAALDSGAYAPAIDATAALTRRAHLGGATTMERVTFLERTLGALLRVLSECRLSPGELSSARRICAALRHWALEETGELARCG
jgi:hypothetical protein